MDITALPTAESYEVWSQTGGFSPLVRQAGLTQTLAEQEVLRLTENDLKYRRAEAMPVRYFVVKATTHYREVR